MEKNDESKKMHLQPKWYQMCTYLFFRFVMCHPKAVISSLLAVLTYSISFHYLTSDSPDEVVQTSPQSIELNVPGIYFCQTARGQDAHGAAARAEPIQGKDSYQLSLDGHTYPFQFDAASGKLYSKELGSGRIYIDEYTTEIIIEFEGWKLKRLSQC